MSTRSGASTPSRFPTNRSTGRPSTARDAPFVREVVALSDRCCDELLDAEFRTICRRILARVAARDPRPLRRSTQVARCAAGLVWLAGRANGEFGRRGRRSAQWLWAWFGVNGCAERGHSLRAAAGLLPDGLDPYPRDDVLTLGDVELLHSRYRAGLVTRRGYLLEIAERRRTWKVEGCDGRTARVELRADPLKPLTAIKGVVPDTGRGTVIIGFGDHVDDARYVLLTVPDAHELVRMVQGALDAPFPIGS